MKVSIDWRVDSRNIAVRACHVTVSTAARITSHRDIQLFRPSILLASVSYRDVAITTVCLQQRNSRDHRCDNQHIRERVRQHLLHDLFRLLRQVMVRNQSPDLLLQRRVTTQQLHAPMLQRLDARVLVDRIAAIRVFSAIVQSRPCFARIIGVLQSGAGL